jgi:asparagine synthase (glutamine-hydrolysing)
VCGIAGQMARPGTPVDRAAIKAIGRSLAHRGPDGSGEYFRDDVGFHHGRLAIIDLVTGAQPLFDDAERALIVNGEIYNYRELRETLPLASLRTQSDCEPLLHLYASQDLAFLQNVRGMYALALYDPARKRLILARDPFGIKQLYYIHTDAGLFFASEPQALIRAHIAPASVRSAAAHELLQLQFTTGAETIFSGIYRLLPGEMLVVEKGAIVARRQMQNLPEGPTRSVREPAALATLNDVLVDAVTIHQRSDVPYGLFLSSGIDSAAILKCMSMLNSEPVRTYTAAFPETGAYDERDGARQMANAAGAFHIELPVTAAQFFERLPQICAAVDDPVCDFAIVPYFLLAERAARDVKVVLCGLGGDELLAGYGRYRRQMLPWWLGGRARRRHGPCDGLDLFRQPNAGWRDGIAAAETAVTTHHYNRLQQAQAVDFVDWLPHCNLIELDRCLMHWGLEGRTPLLEPAVAAFSFLLPNRLKLRRGQGKFLLRKWLAEHFAAAEPFARKRGFTVPVGEWIAGKSAELGELVAQDPGIAELCFPDVVESVFANSGKSHRLLAWRLLFYALWHRYHVRGLKPTGDVFSCLESAAPNKWRLARHSFR